MFKDLMVLEKQRTGKEAFGFYLAYLLLSVVVFGVVGGFIGAIGAPSDFGEGFEQGQAIGGYLPYPFSLVLSALVLFRKGHLKSFGFVLIGLSSGVLAWFFAPFLGLVPTAYLTTIKPVDRGA